MCRILLIGSFLLQYVDMLSMPQVFEQSLFLFFLNTGSGRKKSIPVRRLRLFEFSPSDTTFLLPPFFAKTGVGGTGLIHAFRKEFLRLFLSPLQQQQPAVGAYSMTREENENSRNL